MLTVKAVRERIEELSDEVEAFISLAQEEERDLTPEEQTRIDAIQGSGEETGEIGAMENRLESLLKVENRKKAIAAKRAVDSGDIVTDRTEGEINMAAVKVPAKARARGKVKAFAGPDAEKEAYIAGLFFQAALFNNPKAEEKLGSLGIQMSQSVGDNTKGGYLVPEILENTIIRNVEMYGVARQHCRVMPLGPGELVIPRRAGGYTAYFAGESTDSSTAAVAKSDITLDQIKLSAKKLMVLSEWSSELPEDAAVALGDLVTQEIAFAFANKEDECLFNGDGTSTYGGIVGLANALAAGATVDAASGDNTFAEIEGAVFEEAIGSLLMVAGIQPEWYCHQSFWANVMLRLAQAAGGNTTREVEGGTRLMYLGYPVNFAQVMANGGPATDNAGNYVCYFGDMSLTATFGDKRGMNISSDTSGKYFDSDMIGIKGRERFDVNVHERGDATNAGTMVGIKATA